MHTCSNPNLENKNTADGNVKSNNLACLKTEKLCKPKLKKKNKNKTYMKQKNKRNT